MIYTKHRAVKSLKPNSEWSWGSYDYKDLQWHSSDTPPTEAEIDAELARLNNAEPMKLLREERNIRLAACDWVVLSDSQLTTTKKTAWKTYRQSLRDLPASASPKLDSDGNLDISSVTFPTEPS
tara:strand:- start:894 stop:1265 length:372 start_codon:yes stop_codon:yes gene_type:complete